MNRRGAPALVALLLGGCIPQVAPPPDRYDRPPPPPPRHNPPPPRASLPPAEPSPPASEDFVPRRGDEPVSALPAPRPAWEARPVTPDAVTVAAGTATVAPGESLGRLAERTGASQEAIARANDLAPPYTLRAGQRLTIPAGRYHVVRAGQTGIAIARAYGVEWSRVVAANGLAEPYVLRVGQRVVIPGEQTGQRGVAERAAAFTLDIDDILTGGEPALASNQAPARPVATTRRVLPTTAAVAAPARLTGGFGWPVEGQVVKRFGRGASGERNDGIKIAVPVSTPIHAAADGVVAYAGDGIAALGGLIIVKHGGSWTSVYGHASKLLVQRGQSVKRGQTIALSGDTGFADQPEVHFELRKGRTPVDPQSQLPRG